MVFRELRYFCTEAFKSILYNILMTLTSIITVTGCLLFLGTFTLFSVNITHIADQIQKECGLAAYIDPVLSDAAIAEIGTEIQSLPNVAEIELITKKQALEEAKEIVGKDSASLDGMENEGFLRASYSVFIHDLEQSASTAETLRTIEGIQEVKEQQDITNNVLSFTNVIKVILMVAMGILALIAIFIISNTIKLAVFAREKEIHIMKYIGATDWFIRWPFIIEGIFVGLMGGIISLLACMGIYGACVKAITGTNGWFSFSLFPFGSIVGILALVLLLFGAFMGAIGSTIAVRRHLKV